MRKGYTIIELIVLLGLIVLVLILAFKPIRVLISDVPRQHRDFQTARSLNHMFACLKTDIESAKKLTAAGDPNTLIIDGSITYHFDNDYVSRINIHDPNAASSLWTLPHSRLVWEVKNQNALQITGWLERTVLGKTEINFHNSHLFYAKGFKSGEIQ
jgi:hypothetical protein